MSADREGARGGARTLSTPKISQFTTRIHQKNLLVLKIRTTNLYYGQEQRHPNSQTYFTTLPADDESQNKSVNYIPNQIQM